MGLAHSPSLQHCVSVAHGTGTRDGSTSSSTQPKPRHPGAQPGHTQTQRSRRAEPASSPPLRSQSLGPPRLRPSQSIREGQPTGLGKLTEAAGQSPRARPPWGRSVCLSPPLRHRAGHSVLTRHSHSAPWPRRGNQGGARGAGYAPRNVPQGVILAGCAHLRSDARTQGPFLLEKVAAKTSVAQGPGEPPSPAANQSQGADNHKSMPCQ